MDKSTNLNFYYNAKTQETKWDMPVSWRSRPRTVSTASSINVADWEEVTDPSSLKTYYYNTKTQETSWTNPAERLGGGWVAREDPNSKQMYYYNEKTQETSWTIPKRRLGQKEATKARRHEEGGIASQEEEDGEKVGNTGEEGVGEVGGRGEGEQGRGVVGSKNRKRKQPVDPSSSQEAPTKKKNWDAHLDEVSGKHFYVNRDTGEKTWTPPPITKEASIWRKAEDDQGQTYFYEISSLQTAWTVPPFGQLEQDTIYNPDKDIMLALSQNINMLFGFDKVHGEFTLQARSGVLLYQLLELACPGALDPRAMHTDLDEVLTKICDPAHEIDAETKEEVLQKVLENHRLVIGSIKRMGAQLSSLVVPTNLIGKDLFTSHDPEDLQRAAILEVVWEILKMHLMYNLSIFQCFPLVHLLRVDEKIQELEAEGESQKLVRWMTYHTQAALDQSDLVFTMFDAFGTDHYGFLFSLALTLSHLLAQGLPPSVQTVLETGSSDSALIDATVAYVLQNAATLGCQIYVTSETCVRSNDERLQEACAATLFNLSHGLPEANPLDDDEILEYERLEDDLESVCMHESILLKNWVNSLNIPLRSGVSEGVSQRKLRVWSPNKPHDSTNILFVHNVFVNLSDGVGLVHILARMAQASQSEVQVDWARLQGPFFKEANCEYALELGKALGLDLDSVSSQALAQLGPDAAVCNQAMLDMLTTMMIQFNLVKLNNSSFYRNHAEGHAFPTQTTVLNIANERIRMGAFSKKLRSMEAEKGTRTSVSFNEKPAVVSRGEATSPLPDQNVVRLKRSSLRNSWRKSNTSFEEGEDLISLTDASIKNCCYLLTLLDAVEPGQVKWTSVVPPQRIQMQADGLEKCESNSRYVVSLAIRMGCELFLDWSDIVDIDPSQVLILLASIIGMEGAPLVV